MALNLAFKIHQKSTQEAPRINKKSIKNDVQDIIPFFLDFSRLWSRIDSESIDYGLLEKTNNIYVIKAEFDWNDLGSWNSIFEFSSKNKENNAIRGQGVVIDGKNNFIESQNQFTAIIGQNDLVVVSTDDATLVVSRSRVEEVKRVINFLEDSKNKKLL